MGDAEQVSVWIFGEGKCWCHEDGKVLRWSYPSLASKLQGCICREDLGMLLVAQTLSPGGFCTSTIPGVDRIPLLSPNLLQGQRGRVTCRTSCVLAGWGSRALLSSIALSRGNPALNVCFKPQVLAMAKKSGVIKAQLLSCCRGSAGERGNIKIPRSVSGWF